MNIANSITNLQGLTTPSPPSWGELLYETWVDVANFSHENPKTSLTFTVLAAGVTWASSVAIRKVFQSCLKADGKQAEESRRDKKDLEKKHLEKNPVETAKKIEVEEKKKVEEPPVEKKETQKGEPLIKRIPSPSSSDSIESTTPKTLQAPFREEKQAEESKRDKKDLEKEHLEKNPVETAKKIAVEEEKKVEEPPVKKKENQKGEPLMKPIPSPSPSDSIENTTPKSLQNPSKIGQEEQSTNESKDLDRSFIEIPPEKPWEIVQDFIKGNRELDRSNLNMFFNAFNKSTLQVAYNDTFLGSVDSNKIDELISSVFNIEKYQGKDLIFIPFISKKIVGFFYKTEVTHYCFFVLSAGTKANWLECYQSKGTTLIKSTSSTVCANLPITELLKKAKECLSLKTKKEWKIFDHNQSSNQNNTATASDQYIYLLNFLNKRIQKDFLPVHLKITSFENIKTEIYDKLVLCFPKPIHLASDTREIKSQLKIQKGRILKKSASKLIEENSNPYLKEGQKIDEEKLLKQIGYDFQRTGEGEKMVSFNQIEFSQKERIFPPQHVFLPLKDLLSSEFSKQFNEKHGCSLGEKKTSRKILSCNSISTIQVLQNIVKKFTQDEQKALKILSLLHQGVFSPVQEKITTDLQLGQGMESKFFLNGNGEKTKSLLKERGSQLREYMLNPIHKTIECKGFFELQDANTREAYAIIQATVKVDLKNDRASESWHIAHVFD